MATRFDINDENQMQDLYRKMRPVGSGPLGVMRIAYELIEAIAKEKGFNLEPDTEEKKNG